MKNTSSLVSITQLIKRRNILIDGQINDNRFPMPERISNIYKLFFFGEIIPSDDAVQNILKKGWKPANCHELILWSKWNESDTIVALGAPTKNNNNCVYVPCLSSYGLKHRLSLELWDISWNYNHFFLAVRG